MCRLGGSSPRDSTEHSWHNKTRLRTKDQARNGVMSRDTSSADAQHVRHAKETLSRIAGK